VKTKYLKWISALTIFGLVLLGLSQWIVCYSLGSTELKVVFTVVDTSGNPIESAKVRIVSYGGWYRGAIEVGQEEFAITTDSMGVASYTCHHNWVTSTENVFGITLTRNVRLPYWRVIVSAPGYLESENLRVDAMANQRRIRQVGTREDELPFTVELDRRVD
jgi:hypothetical protein